MPNSITLIAVPRTSIYMPSPALSVLKASLQHHGHVCNTVDMNIELYNCSKENNLNEYNELDNYFQADLRYLKQTDFPVSELLDKSKSLSTKTFKYYQTYLTNLTESVLSRKDDWIGISILSVNSILPAIDLCKTIKNISPTQKIVLGGPGVSTFGIRGKSNFGEFMIEQKLATTYIQGEGENALAKVLEGETKPIVAEQIENLDDYPFPDYSDFDFTKYDNKNNIVAITGSRGCVRNCTFCDIKSAWKHFRYRSGKNLTDEIVNHFTRYGSTEFHFTDSLINGSLKAFGEFLDSMIEAKEKGLIDDSVKWQGQFICRPKHQFPEQWYARMKQAGAGQLHIGIESGSESVLKDMGKPLKRLDIDFMMNMLLKYEIQCDMLMIIGYPTETKVDFDDTLQLINDYKIYNDAGVISGINLGKTMVVLPGSPIGLDKGHWGIDYDENDNWISTKNPSLNYQERVSRRIQAQKVCEDLGYTIRWPLTTLKTIKSGLEKKNETI